MLQIEQLQQGGSPGWRAYGRVPGSQGLHFSQPAREGPKLQVHVLDSWAKVGLHSKECPVIHLSP